MEAAGVVEAVGEGVDDLAVGERVAYAGGPLGAYAERRNCPPTGWSGPRRASSDDGGRGR